VYPASDGSSALIALLAESVDLAGAAEAPADFVTGAGEAGEAPAGVFAGGAEPFCAFTTGAAIASRAATARSSDRFTIFFSMVCKFLMRCKRRSAG
jgi:hypothetical protein